MTARTLYAEMLRQSQTSRLSPIGSFNIDFFFRSVVYLLNSEFLRDNLVDVNLLRSDESITAVNFPSDISNQRELHIKTDLISKYVLFIKRQSRPQADNYDVSYAVQIIEGAIDGKSGVSLIDIWNKSISALDHSEPNFDEQEWLSGFVV